MPAIKDGNNSSLRTSVTIVCSQEEELLYKINLRNFYHSDSTTNGDLGKVTKVRILGSYLKNKIILSIS